jgi:predicted nucleic acid-binding protein
MKVVSNTSPIIFLSKIEALDLLPQCFDQVMIPPAVLNELSDLLPPKYIEPTSISTTGQHFVRGALDMMCSLHVGELEAMVLAQETQADYVILDDKLARRKAQLMGLNVIGTIGVLLLAHQQKLILTATVEEHLASLTQKHGMHISLTIMERVKMSLQD